MRAAVLPGNPCPEMKRVVYMALNDAGHFADVDEWRAVCGEDVEEEASREDEGERWMSQHLRRGESPKSPR
jgi:hypothetical protein